MADPAERPLPAKQQVFVDEYLIDLNATRAYQRAYGCEEKVAGANGARLLKNARVAALIAEKMQERSARTQITADRVLEELAAIGFSDIRKAVTWQGVGENLTVTPLESDEIDEVTIRAVGKVKAKSRTVRGDDYSETTVDVELGMHDKLGALQLIGRHLGMFKDKTEHEAGPSLIDLLRLANKPPAGQAPALPASSAPSPG